MKRLTSWELLMAMLIGLFILLIILYFSLEVLLPIYTQDSIGLMDSMEIKEGR